MNPSILRRWETVPGMMSTHEGLKAYAERLVVGELSKTGKCRPQWIIVRNDDAFIVTTPFEDDLEKRMHHEWIRRNFAMDGTVERYAFVSEVWVSREVPGSPGVFAGRIDGLIIHVQDRDGQSYFKQAELKGLGRARRMTNAVDDAAKVEGPLMGMFVDPSQAPKMH